ncbi:hypothetical protein J1N35_007939 [Gossypium stocksii]|uniref:RNase H type-1 domain-containing protein n=1 Tax=Gossypium stocksii TaxID=47602 RepID=A0A9D3W7E2_9ROSI|nr:hypothetical protein J1N35_007939 [Gossypium stocksii]
MLIQNRNYDGVRIQYDSMEVVKAIQHFSLTSSNSAIIRRIRHLLVNAKSWVIQHFPRDCNKIADCLAKMALDTNKGLKTFEEIPKEVLALSPIIQSSDSLTQRNIM